MASLRAFEAIHCFWIASQAYNDETRNPVIARHEAIQIQATQSGLLRFATNDNISYKAGNQRFANFNPAMDLRSVNILYL